MRKVSELFKLQNILDVDQFASLVKEGKTMFSSLPWWKDCIDQVKLQVLTDKTTSRDNLREKIKNYASNYICLQTETAYIQKDTLLEELANEVEKGLKDVSFDQRPLASVAAQRARASIPEDPEKRFIKLR